MGDDHHARAGLHRHLGATVVAAGAFAALTWTGWSGAELSSASRASRSAADGLIGGVFFAGAVIAALHGGRHSLRTGRAMAVGATVAGQALLVSLVAITEAAPHTPWVLVGLTSVGLIGTVLVGVALRDARRQRHQVDDEGFALGMGMGLLAACHLTMLIPLASPVDPTTQAVVGLVVVTHVAAVALVAGVVPRRTLALLAATGAVGDSLLLLRISPLEGSLLDVVFSLGLAAAGAAWLARACLALSAPRHAAQPEEEIDLAALASTRDQRERLHELRSTVAGLVNSSALIEDPAVPLDVRSHMWESVRSELDRMQRLLSSQVEHVSAVDVDEVLGPVLDMQRCKGRRVEMHTTGDHVQGRRDAVAEVVNILLDNAATHGGCETSRVEVSRRDDDTVDISVTDDGQGVPDELRERVFGWGDHREDSPGEGIGLSLARRLVSQDGGTLRLVQQAEASGATFVISLPAVRQSEENGISEGDPRVARHRSS